jgi:predicted DNA-binding WGR domain protein
VFRPQILRNFGWNVIDIPSHDWTKDPQGVLELIERALTDYKGLLVEVGIKVVKTQPSKAPETEKSAFPQLIASVEETVSITEEVEIASSSNLKDVYPTPDAPESINQKNDDTNTHFRKFLFQQGASNKFWHIGSNGLEMIVEYGRVGTRGQRLAKAFETEVRVNVEMTKLINEKVKKGYLEVVVR